MEVKNNFFNGSLEEEVRNLHVSTMRFVGSREGAPYV